MKSPLRVLMLEDDLRDADLIVATLARDGIECLPLRIDTGKEFESALQETAFDVILSDCSMPSFDGMSALRTAIAMTPDTPFIFVSGSMGEEVAIETLKNGATDYVLKNRLSRLGPAVRRAIAEAEQRVAHEAAERERARAESLFRALFDQIAIGVVISDLEGRIVKVNTAAQSMFGYPEAEFCALHTASLTASRTCTAPDGIYRDLVSGARVRFEVNERYSRRDGTMLWGRSVVSVIRENNVPCFLVTIIEDVTERKKLEQGLIEAQKMEVVGRLAAGIAHDFNNLLTVINGYSGLLLSRLNSEEPVRHELEQIQSAGHRASTLTQRLLSFSRQQKQQTALINLNSVITGLDHMLQQAIGGDIHLSTSLEPDIGLVEADQTQIEQILLNLMINSRDAMPEGGEIKISTDRVTLDACTGPLKGLDPGKYVALTVTDTGLGMDSATKEHVFEPFFTTKEIGKGTGLGLWMVSEITLQHGGTISVDSEVGRGTSFQICLPRMEGSVISTQEPSQVPAQGETILVAEDDGGVRELLQHALETAGYRLLLARNGPEALAIAEREESEIALLVTDFAMPGMRGSDLATQLMTIRPFMSVLCISGYSDDELPTELPTGWRLLRKPFSRDALLNSVRERLCAIQKRSVLVVDDDPSVRMFVGDVLRTAGYLVSEAANGRQALEQLRTHKCDLLITDLIMQEHEGIETFRAARDEFPSLRVVATSGTFGEPFLKAAKYLDAKEVLSKPFGTEPLLQSVKRALGISPGRVIDRVTEEY
jgi:two-component system cell cycle sensor histidine kinase/response regulator CckA